MDHASLDRMLAASGATTLDADDDVQRTLLAVARQAQHAGRRSPRRTMRLVPLLAIGGLAVTGAATVWVTSVQPDVQIPIAYTTDTGRSVECMIQLEVPDPEIRSYLQATDWGGVGQRIYDQALAASAGPNVDGLVFDSTAEREGWEWFAAADDLTTGTVPPELLAGRDVLAAADSSCTGDLH